MWLPRAVDVSEFLAEEARLRRLPRNASERLMQLAKAAGEVEELFFGDGDGEVECLGFYVVRLGSGYRVYVVVAHYPRRYPGEPTIEVINIEEWAAVSRARQLARA